MSLHRPVDLDPSEGGNHDRTCHMIRLLSVLNWRCVLSSLKKYAYKISCVYSVYYCSKVLGQDFFIFLKKKTHQGWIYLIKNTVKTVKLWNIMIIQKSCFLNFTLSFGNHFNILICCSRNIPYYYQCWKQLCSFFFFFFFLGGKPWYSFSGFFDK